MNKVKAFFLLFLLLGMLPRGAFGIEVPSSTNQPGTRFALSFEQPLKAGRVTPEIGPQGELHSDKLAPGYRGLGLAATLLFRHDDIINLRRGTLAFRVKFTEAALQHPQGSTPLDVYPGPPDIRMAFNGRRPDPKQAGAFLPDQFTVRVSQGYTPDFSHYEVEESITATNVGLQAGQWLHVAWTWQGMRHRLFVNGRPVAEKLFLSPLPPIQKQMLRMNGSESVTLDEVAVYDFPFSENEALAAMLPEAPFPMTPKDPHGPVADALWAPGDKRFHVIVDAGNDMTDAVFFATVKAIKEPKTVISEDTLTAWRDGFSEKVMSAAMGEHSIGTFHTEVDLKDREGKVLASLRTTPYTVPENDWLGNTKGLTDKVQPPWTPIREKDKTLMVWGREYRLAGGYGLPQQIVSKGESLLQEPASLKLVSPDGTEWPITKPSVRMISVKPHEALWEGQADAGPVTIRIRGKLEYDGMMLVKLSLAPSKRGTTVQLGGVQLQMSMPDQRALFMNTSTDQGYWWYPQTPHVPKEPGPFFNNLKYAGIAQTKFLFYTLFSDHDRALEWFCDKPENWHVDLKQPIQVMSREPDGHVQLTCHLANQPWTLSEASGDITFGYMATPVKPLPADWRSTYVHYYPIRAWYGDKDTSPLVDGRILWWIWGDGDKWRGNVFNVYPADPEGWAARYGSPTNMPQWLQDFGFARKRKIAPFTNQHVLVPSPRHGGFTPEGWAYLNNMLQMETGNDGWTAMPTRGLRDYWADNLDRWIKAGGVHSIYIDEANTQTCSFNLLSGSGYIKDDGTHGAGHNTLGMREQIKRVRQVFIENGMEPLVWIPMYRKYTPHAYAFVDVVSEGEAFMFEKPEDPDFIDTWANEQGGGYDWSVGLVRAQKFGTIPIFLNYLKFFNKHEEYIRGSEAMVAWLSQLDIIPYNTTLGYWFQARQEFRISDPDVLFHPFWEQTAIVPRADADQRIKVGYYTAKNRALVYVSNLGKNPFAGTLSIDFKALGLSADTAVVEILPQWELKEKITSLDMRARKPQDHALTVGDGGQVLLTEIPSHSFRIIRIGNAQAAP